MRIRIAAAVSLYQLSGLFILLFFGFALRLVRFRIGSFFFRRFLRLFFLRFDFVNILFGDFVVFGENVGIRVVLFRLFQP